MQLLIGSNNIGKIEQFSRLLAETHVEILTPANLGLKDLDEETGLTYKENATLKAWHFYTQAKIPTIADDSGIEITALRGELGVKSRRWGAGPDVSDEEWIAYFFKRMSTESDRSARFISHLTFIDETETEQHFTGICEGTVLNHIQAPYPNGLPLSGCFVPTGFNRVYTELTTAEEAQVNHRGKAVTAFRDWLLRQYNT